MSLDRKDVRITLVGKERLMPCFPGYIQVHMSLFTMEITGPVGLNEGTACSGLAGSSAPR